MLAPAAPQSEAELFARARALAGRPLADVAARLGRTVPDELTRAKGWVGQTIELALGATAGARAEPDFAALGVELKTLPIDHKGTPRESTFLCSLSPDELVHARWEASRVRAKLARVLWLPIEADPGLPIARRRIGSPLLWSPDETEERLLREDWDHFAHAVAHGWLDTITAHAGEVLQIRPKAANNRARRWVTDPEGAPSPTLPKGFYLRARFTAAIVSRSYVFIAGRR